MADDNEDRVFTVEKAKALKPIANGDYTGVIVDINYRTTKNKYEYADVVIKVDGLVDTNTTYGFPAKNLTPSNGLGKFIGNWQKFAVGEQISPKKILVGKKVAFTIANIPSEDDPTVKYPRVVKGTLVPMN